MVIRVNKNNNYTTMSNYHLRDTDLSLKAKGLLSLMLSLPDDWNYSINGLVAICKENETAVKSTLNELKECGYLIVTKKMPNETTSGRIEYIYDVYEQKQEGEKQGVENLPLEIQGVENQGQLNTNNKITDNKELNINYITPDGFYDYQKIADIFNSICVSLPKVKILTETRKRAIRTANKQIKGDWEQFFTIVAQSDFLSGKSGKWKASFDWILKSANTVKILEGNYNNKKDNGFMEGLMRYVNE